MRSFALAIVFCVLSGFAFAQQPQTSDVSNTQPIYSANSKYVQGVGPGYWPTAGSGLTLNLTAGTVWCQGTVRTYAAGTLMMTNSTTNYVYLDPASNCVPAVSTSSFSATQVPIAVVVAAGGVITSITDDRALISNLSSAQLSDGSNLATKAAVQQQSYICANDTGSANAYAITQSPAPTVGTYSQACFQAANPNTTTSTLSVNSVSHTIKKWSSGTLVVLASGDISANQIIHVDYDSANSVWVISSGSGGGGASWTFVDHETPSGSINGSNTAFSFAHTPVSGSEICKLNGLAQRSGAGNDYTISSASIAYLFAPATGDTLDCSYRY